jgi:hypothetical protein
MQISSRRGCNTIVSPYIVLLMSKTNEMNQIVSTIIRNADETEYLRLVKAGIDETTAFEQAVNSSWELLPEDPEEDLIASVRSED